MQISAAWGWVEVARMRPDAMIACPLARNAARPQATANRLTGFAELLTGKQKCFRDFSRSSVSFLIEPISAVWFLLARLVCIN
jgi:hypothetical protein